jgi:hypothetical protein
MPGCAQPDGMTSDLAGRAWVGRLVYFEAHEDAVSAAPANA